MVVEASSPVAESEEVAEVLVALSLVLVQALLLLEQEIQFVELVPQWS